MALGLWREYLEDARRTYADRKPSALRAVFGPLVHPGLRAAMCYRIAHRLQRWRGLRLGAALIKRFARLATGCDIHPAARIGGGLHLPHPIGIVIGPSVTIDGPATIFQDVTIGERGGNDGGGPHLERYTFVYPGARVLGRITIGERSQIGPNCVIYRDLPAGTTVLPPEPLVLEGLSFTLRFDSPSATSPSASASASREPAPTAAAAVHCGNPTEVPV